MVGIAQLVRALDCGSRGRRFDSDYPPHLYWAVAKSVRHGTLTAACVGSSPASPAKTLKKIKYGPLAQLAEHLTFNQGVRSSNLRWITKKAEPKRYNVDLVSNREGLRAFRKPSFVIKT